MVKLLNKAIKKRGVTLLWATCPGSVEVGWCGEEAGVWNRPGPSWGQLGMAGGIMLGVLKTQAGEQGESTARKVRVVQSGVPRSAAWRS